MQYDDENLFSPLLGSVIFLKASTSSFERNDPSRYVGTYFSDKVGEGISEIEYT